MRALDLIGHRFGQLLVVERRVQMRPSGQRHARWTCKCDCGTTTTVSGTNLCNGHVRSCGCYRRSVTFARTRIHGQSESQTYKIWCGMKRRCFNANEHCYPIYGGRGITMCERWRENFEAFLADIGPCPGRGWSIERHDTNGDYEPGNCSWIRSAQQSSNTRRNRFVSVNGERMTVSQASRHLDLPENRVFARIYSGWSVERALGLSA